MIKTTRSCFLFWKEVMRYVIDTLCWLWLFNLSSFQFQVQVHAQITKIKHENVSSQWLSRNSWVWRNITEAILEAERPVVFVSHYEHHHSNDLTWRESIARCFVIALLYFILIMYLYAPLRAWRSRRKGTTYSSRVVVETVLKSNNAEIETVIDLMNCLRIEVLIRQKDLKQQSLCTENYIASFTFVKLDIHVWIRYYYATTNIMRDSTLGFFHINQRFHYCCDSIVTSDSTFALTWN